MNMYIDYLCQYGAIDIDLRKKLMESQYFEIGVLMLNQMFTFNSLDYNTFMLCELLLNLNGCCVLGKIGDDIVPGLPLFEKIDNKGVPMLSGGVSILGDKLDEFYLIRNNQLLRSEALIIDKYAFQLMRVDFSQGKLVQKSVCNPIPVAKTRKAYDGIKECLKNSNNEDIMVLQLEQTWADNIEGKNDYDLIEFTDIANADKFKYLSSYHNDLTARAFFLYGFALQSPTKQAQTNDSELDYRNECSNIYVTNRYNTRYHDYKEACEHLNIPFDFSWSDLWKNSNPIYVNDEVN